MKYVRQFAVILVITCIGELIKYAIPLPIPAGVYGLILMLALLIFKVLKPEDVNEAGMFLIEIMPLMFIPAAVGILTVLEELGPILFPVLVITLVSTVVVMVSSGKATEKALERKKK